MSIRRMFESSNCGCLIILDPLPRPHVGHSTVLHQIVYVFRYTGRDQYDENSRLLSAKNKVYSEFLQ